MRFPCVLWLEYCVPHKRHEQVPLFQRKLGAPVAHRVAYVVIQRGNKFNFLLIVFAPQQELSQSDCFYIKLMK